MTKGRVKSSKPDRDVYQDVTDRMISALERGTVPWREPWKPGQRPRSMSTRKPYRGINVLLLGLTAQEEGYLSPWWGTYNQIRELGGQVRKGERGTLVTLWKSWTKTETDETTGEKVARQIMVIRGFVVFNANQADGLPDRFYPEPGEDIDPITEPQAVLDAYYSAPNAPQLFHAVSAEAYYAPSFDQVHLPPRSEHKSAAHYYTTAFHETVHSTGHPSRLNRKDIDGFSHGNTAAESYAKEELVAEMGDAILCTLTGIQTDELFDNSAAYIASWLRRLADDKKLVIGAAAAAQRAVDLITDEADETEDDESEDERQPQLAAAA